MPEHRTLWAECPECGHQVRFLLPDDIADMERTIESLGRQNLYLDGMIEEHFEADTHFLLQFCQALGLHKAQSVDLALAEIYRLRKENDGNE